MVYVTPSIRTPTREAEHDALHYLANPFHPRPQRHLSIRIRPGRAVRGVDFDLHPGRTLGIVGESGSGKSVTSLAVMGLLPDYAKVEGSVQFDGQELIGLSDKQLTSVRGAGIGMIFQDPLSALTPVFSIGHQLVEAINVTRMCPKGSVG